MFANKNNAQLAISSLLATCATLGVWSCKPVSAPEQVAITFDSLCYHINQAYPAIEGKEKPCLDIDVSVLPAVKGASKEVVDKANRFIAEMLVSYGGTKGASLKDCVSALVDNHIAHYRDWVSSEADNYASSPKAAERWLSSEFSLEGKPVFNRNGVLTYGIAKYENSGSQHGESSYNYSTCSFEYLPDGKSEYVCHPISLADVVLPDSLESLNAILVNRIVKLFNAKNYEQLLREGPLFENAEVSAVDNFYLTNEGINFVYNMYEIAPYAAGTIELSTTWDELKPLMPAESPLMRIVNTQLPDEQNL
ncbi:MAG: RsiV family protein [Bacteroidales bacterium]|nr:RsiV family protein [Bacteroidales bacterium]